MLIDPFMHQDKQREALNFCMFSFLLLQVFTVSTNRKLLCFFLFFFLRVQKKCRLACWLLYFFFLAYKICYFFLKSQVSRVLSSSSVSWLKNLHTVMQYSSPGKIFMAYVNEIRPAPGGIDRMLSRKLTVY